MERNKVIDEAAFREQKFQSVPSGRHVRYIFNIY